MGSESEKKIFSKQWLKILTKAHSYAGITGKKSPLDMGDLALDVLTKWRGNTSYNLHEISKVTGISKNRLTLLAHTAEFFPQDKRQINLSISHHIEVMRGDPENATFWLEQAQKNAWNSKEIRLAIAGDGDPKKLSWLRCGTFWHFSRCDPRFGIDYPGRIPGQIQANLIHYFTEPDDLVVDLMAGGGSTLDAAKLLNRKCLAYDLVSVRQDIKINDALTEIPDEAQGAKLIFLDPPYGKIALGFYKYHPSCLSQMSEQEFLDALQKIASNCRQALLPKGYIAILVQNVHGWSGSTAFQVLERLQKDGWSLERRIQVPLPTQQISASVMRWAKENRQMVNIDRDLLILKVK